MQNHKNSVKCNGCVGFSKFDLMKKSGIISKLILSYLITFAIFNLGRFESSDILLGVIFAGVFFLFSGKMPGAKLSTASLTYSVIVTVLYVIYSADRLGGGMENLLFKSTYSVLTLLGVFALVYAATEMLLECTTNLSVKQTPLDRFPVRMFFIYALIIFVFMLPLFILNFPATMTVDSFDQFGQAISVYPQSDHHPWAHTLLIKFFYNIGHFVTGSVNGGIGCYTLFQMIILAFSVAYSIASLSEQGLGKMGQVLVLFGYILYPYNLAYSITIWKDVLFSAAVLVLTVTFWRIIVLNLRKPESGGICLRDIILWFISGLGMCLLRHNGFYAYLLTSAVLVFLLIRRHYKNTKANAPESTGKNLYASVHMGIILTTVLTVLLVIIFKGPIQSANNVEQGEFAHNIPIPLQQIARVVSHGGDISPDDMKMIERLNTPEYLRNHYHPGGADPTMQWLIFGDTDYLLEHKSEYLGLWIRIGFKNPIAYVEAYIDQTRGYYTTMQPEQTMYFGILPNELDLYTEPLFASRLRLKTNEISAKLQNVLPVYGILGSPGACFQLLILGVVIIITRSKAKKDGAGNIRILSYLPVAAIIFTILLATPLCADLRYAYSLMICMPTLIAITLL